MLGESRVPFTTNMGLTKFETPAYINLDNVLIGTCVDTLELLYFFSARPPAPTRWVFGGKCPIQNRGFVIPVPNRSAAVLEPLIMRHIAPGKVEITISMISLQLLALI